MSKKNRLDALHGTRQTSSTQEVEIQLEEAQSRSGLGGYNGLDDDLLMGIREEEARKRKMESAIIPADDDEGFLYKRFNLSPTGISIPQDLRRDEWFDAVVVLRKLNEAVQWALGDLVNFARQQAQVEEDKLIPDEQRQWHWGESYDALSEATGYKVKSLYEYAYVAGSVDFSIRMETLSFGHHQLVAKCAPKDQQRWLQKAADNGWSIAEMRKQMAAANKKKARIQDDDWLFGKNNVPKVTRQMQALWSKARNGDAKARRQFLSMIDEMRSWMDEAVMLLDE